MRVRFYIEKRRGDDGRLLTNERPIFMTVAFHGKRVLISTGKNVDLPWWDPEKQRVSEIHPEAVSINGWLNSLEYTAGVVWKALVSLSEKPGVNDFRDEFEKLRPRFSGGFFDVMFMFMEEGSKRWSRASYMKVRTFYNQLKEFEQRDAYRLSFNTINVTFLQRFTDFQKREGRGEITIRKMVNTLVWYLNWATEQGYNLYNEYRRFYKLLEVNPAQSHPVPIYLEWEELMVVLNHTFSQTRIERVRDLFCIICFTGIRFGELQRLKRSDVSDSALIIRKRGGGERRIPLNSYAGTLFAKYENRFYRDNAALPAVSAVTFNKYLKVIARSTELNRLVEDPNKSGITAPLCDVITAGVAVQTFIMNALRLDIPLEVISGFTGVVNDQRMKFLKQEVENREMKKFNTIYPQ